MPTRGSCFRCRPSCETRSWRTYVTRLPSSAALAPAEVGHELLGCLAVPVGVVEGDLAVRAAEAQAGVRQHDVPAPGEGAAEVGLVVLRAAEAVGGEDRRLAVLPGGRRRAVQVVDDGADLAVAGRSDGDVDALAGHGDRGGGLRRAGAGRGQGGDEGGGQRCCAEGGRTGVAHEEASECGGFARFNGCAVLRLRSRTAPVTGGCLPLHACPGRDDRVSAADRDRRGLTRGPLRVPGARPLREARRARAGRRRRRDPGGGARGGRAAAARGRRQGRRQGAGQGRRPRQGRRRQARVVGRGGRGGRLRRSSAWTSRATPCTA